MRCLLTSSNIDSEAAVLAVTNLVVGKRMAAIVTTAAKDLKERNRNSIIAKSALSSAGFQEVAYIDLDVDVPRVLLSYDLVYLSGGNPHYLLKRLRETGGDAVLLEIIKNGVPVVASSGGAVVLGISTSIVELFDPNLDDYGFKSRSGLAAFNFTVLPHANRWKGKMADYAEALAAATIACNSPIEELSDGEGLLFQGNEWKRIVV
jgi:peptidase E